MPDYSEDFEAFWKIYPKRNVPHPKKLSWKCWQARLKEGIDPAFLIGCAKRYAAEIKRAGRVGTEYVLQAATFLGPNERYLSYPPIEEKPVVQKPAPKVETLEERIDGRDFIRELLSNLASAKGVGGYVRAR